MPPNDQNTNTQSQDRQNDASRGNATQDQSQQNRDGTLLNRDGNQDGNRQSATGWGDDWRVRMAGGDAERAKALDRFADPGKVWESYKALQQRVGSGELRSSAPKPSGDAATPEALKAWRTERGLPAEVTEIKLPLPAGAKMEDLDDSAKSRIEHFTKTFFDADVPQAAVDKIMSEYNAYAEKEANDRAVADAKLVDGLEDNLRAEWGGDYRTNIAMTDRFLQTAFGEEGADLIMGARTADGRRLFNIPEVFKAITQLARSSGVDDVVSGEVSAGKSVDQRIQEIQNIMQTDRRRYYAEKLDEEYSRLQARKGNK